MLFAHDYKDYLCENVNLLRQLSDYLVKVDRAFPKNSRLVARFQTCYRNLDYYLELAPKLWADEKDARIKELREYGHDLEAFPEALEKMLEVISKMRDHPKANEQDKAFAKKADQFLEGLRAIDFFETFQEHKMFPALKIWTEHWNERHPEIKRNAIKALNEPVLGKDVAPWGEKPSDATLGKDAKPWTKEPYAVRDRGEGRAISTRTTAPAAPVLAEPAFPPEGRYWTADEIVQANAATPQGSKPNLTEGEKAYVTWIAKHDVLLHLLADLFEKAGAHYVREVPENYQLIEFLRKEQNTVLSQKPALAPEDFCLATAQATAGRFRALGNAAVSLERGNPLFYELLDAVQKPVSSVRISEEIPEPLSFWEKASFSKRNTNPVYRCHPTEATFWNQAQALLSVIASRSWSPEAGEITTEARRCQALTKHEGAENILGQKAGSQSASLQKVIDHQQHLTYQKQEAGTPVHQTAKMRDARELGEEALLGIENTPVALPESRKLSFGQNGKIAFFCGDKEALALVEIRPGDEGYQAIKQQVDDIATKAARSR